MSRKTVKTNNAADGFNKMCNNSGTLLNLKYTDAITQLRWQSLYNQYYDQKIQGKQNLTVSRYSGSSLNR